MAHKSLIKGEVDFWQARVRALNWMPTQATVDRRFADQHDMPVFLQRPTRTLALDREDGSIQTATENFGADTSESTFPSAPEPDLRIKHSQQHNASARRERVALVYFSIAIAAFLFYFQATFGGAVILGMAAFVLWMGFL